ncbi:hypothetical protein CRG98_007119 [Punica granatum]|uniref:Uncharacterized protein n=1 Tax=Punica granatum TaxID=22663 RepID=A0A2I0KXG1_PUNGR|nr:hypothetical protein CRG98_007119 [Punica granatum]
MGFWAYHQQSPPKHQWLIPVVSPSEGLVYKPYPGPGYVGPYNGQGPNDGQGTAPFVSSFMGPAYGIPTHFPTYGSPMMGVNTQFRSTGSKGAKSSFHRSLAWSLTAPKPRLAGHRRLQEPGVHAQITGAAQTLSLFLSIVGHREPSSTLIASLRRAQRSLVDSERQPESFAPASLPSRRHLHQSGLPRPDSLPHRPESPFST